MDLNSSGGGQEVHLSHYWNVIYKRWKVALAILAVVMIATFLMSYFQPAQYRSSVMLQIERENPNVLTLEDIYGIQITDQEYMRTQYVLLKSRGLADRVIKENNLLSDPDFYPSGVSGKSDAEIATIRNDQIPRVMGSIDVAPVQNTSLVEVGFVAGTPRLAQKGAEGVAESFIRMNVEKRIAAYNKASEFLTTQIDGLRGEIDVAQQELTRYGESKDIVTPADAGNVTVQRLGMANTDLHAATTARVQSEAELLSVQRGNRAQIAANDGTVQRLTDEENGLQREYSQKLNVYRPEHPDMVAMRLRIEKLKQAREAAEGQAFTKAVEAARTSVEAARAREASLRAAYERQKQEALKLNVNAFTYDDLRKSVDNKRQLLDQLTKQLTETQVSARIKGANTSNISLIDHAQLPKVRHNQELKKNLQSAFPLGLILGLAAIFFLEYMDRSIKTTEELERVTGFASLGVIPSVASLGKEYGYTYSYGRRSKNDASEKNEKSDEKIEVELIPFRNARAPISEAYRAFRTSLLLASATSPKTIVITSSFAREGKTTTATNLATVLAQMGKPVLLIDADLRRPRLQKVFRDKLNIGLVNHLAANMPIADVIQSTDVPNLSIVLSGPTPPNPSELLASDRMKHLIEEIRARYAYVIFDSPPVMAVTDAIVLGANSDGVVLCVHGGQTPRDIVQRAAERLRQANIPVLGAILNNLDLQQYGYTYKKRYYDYYDSEKPASPTAKSA